MDGVLRKICVTAKELGLLPEGLMDKRANKALMFCGFLNCNQALERFHVNDISQSHQFAELQMAKNPGGIIGVNLQLSAKAAKQLKNAQTALLAIISSLRYFARQGLAIRGLEKCERKFTAAYNASQ